ncbi:MAG: NUDIX hydrolase [Gammaproteobacteria bacterium]|nr:NUDIX hydrolase [Gammaproteobacteria bacterium]
MLGLGIVMKPLLLLFITLISLGCSHEDITAAGVIAYAQEDGRRYLLLADHTGLQSHRGYGAFGGGLDKGETFEQGALREFHEETGCHFLGKLQLVSKEYVRNDHYVSFVVRVPYISSEQLNNASSYQGCSGTAYSERKNYIWVEQSQLAQHLQNGGQLIVNGVNVSMWDKSSEVIKLAITQGLL